MKNPIRCGMLVTAILLSISWSPDHAGAQGSHTMSDYLVYIGTYTGPQSKGIYVYRLFTSTGKLTPLGLAAEITSPSFLAVHPNHRFLYSVNETDTHDGEKTGSVSAFSIDPKTGKLTFLNAVSSGGPGPCHVSVDHSGKCAFVANYSVGSVASFPIMPDGRLGNAASFLPHTGHSVDPQRQEGSHAHSIYPSPDNRFVVSADLGTDLIYVYKLDTAKCTLTPNDPPSAAVPPGTGPRHFAFHPSGKYAYAIEEMGSSLTTFTYDAARGVLHPIGTISTVPKDYKGYNDCAELFIHPSGKFLYGSNRGHDSITVFAIDPSKGTPTTIQYVPTGGKTPRGFGIDPSGSFLVAANQDTNSLVVFRIDPQTGRLAPTGQKEEVQSPVCVVFAPVE